jgi:tRNA modification GTPase
LGGVVHLNENDTIAAISTPYGTGAIAIVRMSGKDSFAIASSVLKCPVPFEKIASHRVVHGKVVDPESGETVDDVLVVKMDSPSTFTGEDTVEINCHGGIVIQRRVLGLLLKYGARPAEPGEFTKRAFLNGRIDISQAEAVCDLICAKTELSSKAAIRQLEGRLSVLLKKVRQSLVSILASIDATIDYPDQDIEEVTTNEACEEVKTIRSQLQELISQYEKGKILREGINAVIAGMPNVGKSSLLNRLAGEEKAIVTDIPGTTRDVIEEYISIRGIPVRIMDTAGITETPDRVEQIGVERALKIIEEADLVILMLDASKGIREEERELLNKVSGRRHIVVLNKIDLVRGTGISDIPGIDGIEAIPASMLDGTGLDRLEERISEIFMHDPADTGDILLTNARHKFLLEEAMESLERALTAYNNGMPLDIMAIDIMDAANSIGSITGESIEEEVINEIFSKFCIGK